jgi:hypothetical protein
MATIGGSHDRANRAANTSLGKSTGHSTASRESPHEGDVVLLRADEYKRLKENEYDDSPWTREELQALAWEAGKGAGWEEMDEYDDVPTA